MIWSAPATDSMFATSLADMGARLWILSNNDYKCQRHKRNSLFIYLLSMWTIIKFVCSMDKKKLQYWQYYSKERKKHTYIYRVKHNTTQHNILQNRTYCKLAVTPFLKDNFVLCTPPDNSNLYMFEGYWDIELFILNSLPHYRQNFRQWSLCNPCLYHIHRIIYIIS